MCWGGKGGLVLVAVVKLVCRRESWCVCVCACVCVFARARARARFLAADLASVTSASTPHHSKPL